MATSVAGDFGTCLQIPVYLYEGIWTRTDAYRDDGKIEKAAKSGDVITKGDYVVLYTSTSFQGMTVQKMASNGEIFGKVITTPSGKIPNISSDGGTFTASSESDLRQATVEVYWGGAAVVREFDWVNTESTVQQALSGTKCRYNVSKKGMETTSETSTYYTLLDNIATGDYSSGTYSNARILMKKTNTT